MLCLRNRYSGPISSGGGGGNDTFLATSTGEADFGAGACADTGEENGFRSDWCDLRILIARGLIFYNPRLRGLLLVLAVS